MLLYAVMGVLLAVCIAAVLLMYLKLRAEKVLRRKDVKRLTAILDAVKTPITVTDKDMQWTFVNKAVEDFLGVKREEIIGKKCSHWNANICNTENCGITRLRHGYSETFFEQHDGSFQVSVSYLYDEKGVVDGHVEVVRDITDLKRMARSQAEAESASRAKSAFLAKVSHEIRTPMNAILGITEIQLLSANIPADTQEALGKIYSSGYMLLGIVNDILDLSKIEADKLELSPVNYDVASLISDTIHLNVVLSESKPIAFNLKVDENIPSVLFGDELRIKQILNNLLSNAFKYTDKGEVSLSVAAEYVGQGEGASITLMFRVSDTGQGMTEDQVANLFTEYTRFNTEINRMTEGTGLGMNITKNLVRLMNGEIFVESEKGKGTTFVVYLPQGNTNSGVLGKELVENLRRFHLGSIMQLKKAPQIVREYMPYGKVLVVDDVETNLYVCRGLLAPYGLSVEVAVSGFAAIDKIKNGATFDIIFMDHFMPKMDGIEATRIIRDMGYMRPIVALTANALAGQAEVFLANGFDNFISKPIDIRQLDAVLNQLIRSQYPQETVDAARQLKKEMRQHSGDGAPLSAEQPQSDTRKMSDPQLAAIFAHDAEKAVGILEAIHAKGSASDDDDIQTYIINIHAMKSALANIGEMELSVFARRLEEAGRQKNSTVMSDDTPAFLEQLRAAVKRIKPQEDDDEQSTDADEAYLREQLSAIQVACRAYDKKAAKDVLSDLRHKTWPHSTKELLDAIGEHLLHSDFEEAARACEANF